MSYELAFCYSDIGADGYCIYRKEDFSLQYEVKKEEPFFDSSSILAENLDIRFGIRLPSYFYLNIDTLTLVFGGHQKKLVSLDAYTNIALWQQNSQLNLPNIVDRGSLSICNIPEEEDRYCLEGKLRYEFSSDKQCVRIVWQEEVARVHYEVANNLVVGLLAPNVITDIFMLNVIFM